MHILIEKGIHLLINSSWENCIPEDAYICALTFCMPLYNVVNLKEKMLILKDLIDICRLKCAILANAFVIHPKGYVVIWRA